jgi:hypothetical protein
MGDMRNIYNILIGNPEEKILGRPGCRWEATLKCILEK